MLGCWNEAYTQQNLDLIVGPTDDKNVFFVT